MSNPSNSRPQGPLRCAITGIEVKADEAYVLDLRAAQRRLQALADDRAALERALDLFTSDADRTLANAPLSLRSRVVSFPVAAGLDHGVCKDLFLSLSDLRTRIARSAVRRMKDNPRFGDRLQDVTDEQAPACFDLGSRLVSFYRGAGGRGHAAEQLLRWVVAPACIGQRAPAVWKTLEAACRAGELSAYRAGELSAYRLEPAEAALLQASLGGGGNPGSEP